MSTLNINPLSAGDSSIYSYSNTNWGVSRNYGDLSVTLRGGTTGFLQWNQSAGFTWVCERYFSTFDTSALGAGATITGATFTIYGLGSSINQSTTLQLYTSTCADTLTNADFNTVTLNSPTALTASGIPTGSWNTSGANVFTLNATGISAINKVGKTKFVIRETTYDVSNVAPANVTNQVYFEVGATTNKPVLSITYTSASGAGNFLAFF